MVERNDGSVDSPWKYRYYILLLLLSHFNHVRLCATPEMAAHQAPPSLGFSRPEHWSGLPFPSLMHESEKWKWSRSVMSNSSRPHGLAAHQASLSVGFSRQEYRSGVPLPSPLYHTGRYKVITLTTNALDLLKINLMKHLSL